jgi:RNA-directed DNA polymerase
MKRYGDLFHKIWDINNIRLAHANARKGKTTYKEVVMVDKNIDHYCFNISKMLQDAKFENSDYKIFTKIDKGKTREIYKLPYYPDRIIHHAIMQVLEPIWKKTLITDTFQSIKGRGIHKAKSRIEPIIRSGVVQYCLKIDVKKFYPSIDNSILKGIIIRKVKCKDTIDLLCKILFSVSGVPIGNYLSQYFGNLYLTYFDHWVKEILKVKYYYRYCDDMVFLGTSKKELHRILGLVKEYLNSELHLRLKSDYQVFNVSRGVDFLGFRFFTGYTLIRKRIAKNFISSCKTFISTLKYEELLKVISYYGWIKASNGYNLWRLYTNRVIKVLPKGYNTNTKLIRGML